jgi:hypothetical protein
MTFVMVGRPRAPAAWVAVDPPARGAPSVASRSVRSRLTVWLSLALLALLVLAPAAAAEENTGRGFYGATNDHAVTNAGFILILFFPVLVTVLTLLQRRLEKRKARRKAAEAQLAPLRWHGGW